MKKILSLIIIIVLIFSSVNTFALTEKEYKEKRKKLEQKIKSNKEQNKKDETTIGVEQKNLEALDMAIRQKQGIINQLSDQISVAEADIIKKESEIKEMEDRISAKEKLFAKRIRAMYMRGSAGYLSVLLNSKNIHDYLSNKSMVQMLLKQDQDLIKFISEGKDEIVKRKEEVEGTRDELNKSKEKLELAKAAEKEAREKKNAYIGSLKNTVALRLQEIEEMEKDSKKLESEIAAARRKYSQQLKRVTYVGGKVGWPLAGYFRVSSGFGYRGDPIAGRPAFHTGTDIPAPMGTPVMAAETGVVTYAGWMGSYGNLVVIQHSGSLSTAYAHNSSINVRVGQIVSKGQTISRVGSTGRSTGPHCHFEVRINGRAVNALGYVGRRQ